MKVFLVLIFLIVQIVASGQRSFKVELINDEELKDLLVKQTGLRGVNLESTEIRIWTGSTLIQMEVRLNKVLRAQVTRFYFSINRKEEIKRCYYKTEVLMNYLGKEILSRLNQIDTIPSWQSIPEWTIVLDGDSYGIETIKGEDKSVKVIIPYSLRQLVGLTLSRTFFSI